MGYRAVLQAHHETVQDLELSAKRRLDEAWVLHAAQKYHTAIYVAGLAAEMYLKTACFFLDGARPSHPVAALLTQLRKNAYASPSKVDYEGGHGLSFLAEELKFRRKNHRLRQTPRRFRRVIAQIATDWFIGMRYRPGSATRENAAVFITNVRWLALNHTYLRS